MKAKRSTSFAKRLSAVTAVSIFALAGPLYAQQNLITNPGFEDNPPPNFGNNINYSISPWILGPGDGSNVVQVDGAGGGNYGNGGPFADAQNGGAGAGNETDQHYLDINNGANDLYQSFTVPECTTGGIDSTYTLEGYFSTRDNRAGGLNSIELREGVGLGGVAVVGSNAPVTLAAGSSQNDGWAFATTTVTLEFGETYSFVVQMMNNVNFDEASLVRTTGNCAPVTLDDLETRPTIVPVMFDPLFNDFDNDDELDLTTVSLIPPADAENIVTDLQGNVISFDAPDEGTWSVNEASGEITFTPNPEFFDDPTPAEYTVDDERSLISNSSTLTINYPEADPSIELVKSVASVADTNGNGTVGDAGDIVTFGFTAENTGNTALAGITVSDTGLTPVTLTADLGFDGDLAVGEGPVAIASATYTITPTDQAAGSITNTATAASTPVGYDESGVPIPGATLLDATTDAPFAEGSVADTSDTGTEPEIDPVTGLPVTVIGDPSATGGPDDPTVVTLAAPVPSLEIVKSISGFVDVNGNDILDAGDEVNFAFTGENTGQTALANITVSDTGLSPITLTPATPAVNLAAGDGPTQIATATYVLTASDIANGGLQNSAEGEGMPVATDASGDPDPSTPLVDAGGNPLDPVTDVSDAGTQASIDLATGLPTVVGDPATAETPDENGATDTDPGNDPTALIIAQPSVEITKSVSGYVDTNMNGTVDAGDGVTYSFVVENTGNTDLENVVVTDVLPGIVLVGSPIASLPVGQTDTTSVTASYTLLDGDIEAGAIENSATAAGAAIDEDGNPIGDPFNPGSPLTVSDVSDAGTNPDGDVVPANELVETEDLDGVTDGDPTNDPTVFQITPSPSIEIVKSIASVDDTNVSGTIDAGDIVNYTFAVTNTGNTDLADVTVTDVLVDVSGGPIDLAIGGDDTATFTAAYEIVAADVTAGGVENTAEVAANAVDSDGDLIIDPNTGGTLTTTDDSDSGTEPLLDASGNPIPQTDADTTETAGLDGGTDSDPTNDPTVLFIATPELTVVKSLANALDTNGDGLFGGEGDELIYEFTVTNTGNIDLVDVTVTDATATVSGGPIDLAVGVGDSITFTARYFPVTAVDIVAGFVENTAEASGNGVDDDGNSLFGPTGDPLVAMDTSDTGTNPDGSVIADPSGTETPDGDGSTNGEPGDDPTVSIVPGNPNPELSIIKSVASVADTSGDGIIGAGDTVTYSFVVTNTGNVRMADITVTDDIATVTGGPVTLEVDGVDTTTFTATSVITPTQAAAGAIENTAEVTGGAVNSLGDPISDPDTGLQLTASDTSDAGTDPDVPASGTPTAYADPEGNETPDADGNTDTDPTNDPTVLFLPAPDMTVTKSVASVDDTNGNGLTDAGDTVNYTFAVANTGNTDLADVDVTDALVGVVITGSPIAAIAQGDTDTTVTATYVLTPADIDAGTVENTAEATATAVDSDGNPLGNPVTPGLPLTVADTSDAGTDPDGDPVTDPEGTETPDATGGTDTDPTNDPTVFTVTPSPSLTLTKSVASINDLDGDGLPGAGDQVVFSFVVTNTGNTDLIDVDITDPLGTVTGGPIDLAIGGVDTATFMMTYDITDADVADGFVENTATADGTAVDSAGAPITDPGTGGTLTATDTSDAGTNPELSATGAPDLITDPETTETPDGSGGTDTDPGNDPTVLNLSNPEITLVKSTSNVFDSNGDGLFGGAGDEVTYSFTVTNSGNVDLAGVTVTDSLAIMSGGPIDLAAGQTDTTTFTASYIVTAADVTAGFLENTAEAAGNGVDANGDPLLDLNGDPIEVADTSDAGTDPDQDPIDDPAGTDSPDGSNVTDGDPGNDPTVTLVPSNALPGVNVVKSVASVTDDGDGIFGAGDTITYAFTVTNTGNVDLADVTVTDDTANVTGGPITLGVGESDDTTIMATYVLTAADVTAGGFENTADVTGGAVNAAGDPITDGPGGPQLTATDVSDAGTDPEMGPTGTPQDIADPASTETPDLDGDTDADPTNDPTVLFIPNPSMEVTKSVTTVSDTNNDGLFGGIGDVIEYGFVVTNTGNTALGNVVITDLTATMSGGPIDLAIGASNSTAFTATYTVTANDVDVVGYVENTATVFGDAFGSDGNPLGNPAAPGTPITISDVSDAGTDSNGGDVADPEGTETPDGEDTTDADPTNDPTVIQVPTNPVPSISLIKSVASTDDTNGDQVEVNAGDTVFYTFTVTNTGDANLADVVINDAMLGGEVGTIALLEVGDSATISDIPYTVTDADVTLTYIENTADASGTAVNRVGTPILDPATGEPIMPTTTSDTGTDPEGAAIADPEGTETPNGEGTTDGDPANDPTVFNTLITQSPASISGTVFLDVDTDGAYEPATDESLEGYFATLFNADGDIMGTVTTGADGTYTIAGFPVGNDYVLVFTDPSGNEVGRITNLDFVDTPVLEDQDQPVLASVETGDFTLVKTANVVMVIAGQTVTYEIVATSLSSTGFGPVTITDTLPAGLAFTPDSVEIDGVAVEPVVSGRTISVSGLTIPADGSVSMTLQARVLSSAPTGDIINRADLLDGVTGVPIAETATATIRRRIEAVFQCSDIIGKVFDDVDRDGYQDGLEANTAAISDQGIFVNGKLVIAPEQISRGEPGLAGVRLVTTDGTIITTDEYGRYSVPCAALPGAIGENFTLKLDTNSLPTGYRVTSENPRTMRVTAGILTEMNFGASIGRVVDIDLTASAFAADHEPTAELFNGLDGLLAQVSDTPSILRISYFTNGEGAAAANARLDALEDVIRDKWRDVGNYRLVIERTVTQLQ